MSRLHKLTAVARKECKNGQKKGGLNHQKQAEEGTLGKEVRGETFCRQSTPEACYEGKQHEERPVKLASPKGDSFGDA